LTRGLLLTLALCSAVNARPAHIKLLCWNLYGGRNGLSKIIAVLKASGATVFLLQEAAPPQKGAQDPVAALRHAFPRWSAARGGSRGELLILSKFPLSHLKQPRLGSGRPCLTAECWGITLIDVHYSTAPANQSLAKHKGGLPHYLLAAAAIRAEQTDALVQLIKSSRHPVVVAGDLNSTPLMEPPRRLEALLQPVKTPATYPSSNPTSRIDYIFVSPTLRPGMGEVISTSASDHLPIIVRLR